MVTFAPTLRRHLPHAHASLATSRVEPTKVVVQLLASSVLFLLQRYLKLQGLAVSDVLERAKHAILGLYHIRQRVLTVSHLLNFGDAHSSLPPVQSSRHLVRDERLEHYLHVVTSYAVLVIVGAPLLENLEHASPIELLNLIVATT